MSELANDTAAIYNCLNPRTRSGPPTGAYGERPARCGGREWIGLRNLFQPLRLWAGRRTHQHRPPTRCHRVKGRVRAQMWADALAAHERGDVRVTEVRSSGLRRTRAESRWATASSRSSWPAKVYASSATPTWHTAGRIPTMPRALVAAAHRSRRGQGVAYPVEPTAHARRPLATSRRSRESTWCR